MKPVQAIALTAAILLAACDDITAATVVATKNGQVRGAVEGTTRVFKGIPYAAPPVVRLRFRPPQPAAAWEGVREATQFGSECPQLTRQGQIKGDEDCLTLNVWTPTAVGRELLPVLVFIHGGAFKAGASSLPLYDGRALSERGPAVVVTLNYRIGSLGFLAHPALTAEDEHHSSGNYGLLDQNAALRWVHENIAAFAGDPARVLLFGQSAGAISVCTHLGSELSIGLFSRAMMLSGSCGARPLRLAEQGGVNAARQLGCESAADVAACLRDRSAADIVAVPVNDGQATSNTAGPTVDGWVLAAPPRRLVGSPPFDGVPVIVSTTRDEFTNQLGLYGGTRPVTSPADYEQLIRQLFPSRADAVLARYPVADYASPNEALIALLGDAQFTCPSRTAARQMARSSTPVWRAVFKHRFEEGPLQPLRAAHGFDLFFGFANLGLIGAPASADEQRLSDTLAGLWLHFAATGDVASPGVPEWPRYQTALDDYLAIDQPPNVAAGIRTEQCDFWAN